jgi:vancomycin resistance protein YoaR
MPPSKPRSKSKTVLRRGAQQGLPPLPDSRVFAPVQVQPVSPSEQPGEGAPKPAPLWNQANKSLEEVACTHDNSPVVFEAAEPEQPVPQMQVVAPLQPVVAVEETAAQQVVAVEPDAAQADAAQAEAKADVTQAEAVQADAAQAEAKADVTQVESAQVEAKAGVTQVEAKAEKVAVPLVSQSVGGVLPSQIVRDAQGHWGQTKTRPSLWKWPLWTGAAMGLALLVAGGAAAGAYSRFAASEVIAPNVFIGAVPVGGLTQAQALKRVKSHFGSPRVALECGGEKVQLPLSRLGAGLAVEPAVRRAYAVGRGGFLPSNWMRVYGRSTEIKTVGLALQWNPAQLKTALQKVNGQVRVAPVDARLRAGEDGLVVVPDHPGRAVDLDGATRVLKRQVRVGVSSVALPMRRLNAHVSARSLDGRDVQLAGYTTHFDSGLAGRTQNIRIACRAIQNHVLMPGETFSFNSCTGERTARKGYQMAHIFIRHPGADEPEVAEGLAGGVCQVSSTLFNAVRKTNAKAQINPIKVVERSTHSLPVTYVPPGLDATVAWPSRDFKFRNITDHPVYVRTQMGRSKLSISIWGRVPR